MSPARPLALLRAGLLALVLGLAAATAGPVLAQGATDPPEQRDDIPPPLVRPQPTGPANGTAVTPNTPATPEPAPSATVDFAAWEAMATRAEAALESGEATDLTLDLLRAQLADWRETLLGAQKTNADRIATLRSQIDALGPPPEEGATEAPEIAARRAELGDQLNRLEAPGIAAVEGHRRADGLIREIDRTQRERQANELLQLWPSPIYPGNWPAALAAVTGVAGHIAQETRDKLAQPELRSELIDNLPVILLLLALGLVMVLRARRLVENWTFRLQRNSLAGWRRLSAFLVSLGQILVPAIGIILLLLAIHMTQFTGVVGSALLNELASMAMVAYAAVWLGGWIFPRTPLVARPLLMTDDQRALGRLLTTLFGIVIGLRNIVADTTNAVAVDPAARAVLEFPIILLAGVLLARLGMLLRQQFRDGPEGEDSGGYFHTMLRLLGRAAILIGVVAPLLAAVGYVSAARALVFPAGLTLALIGFLVLLQRVVVEIYAAVTHDEDSAREALVPVLVGFALVIMAVPLFALVWGARVADLTELWTRFQEGFQLGTTRVSPVDFLYFAVVFAFGFTLTRLVQGALRGSILPRTALDQGGQNAVVSGVGYVGIFLAALAAINTAGIDLSGLAIVAGALSVGIGFGLQTIVGNFVSGIILLVERPISEGDWIEVAGVQGTVKSISVRSTRIQTFDRSDVIVPNQDLVAGRVTNWTRFNLSGRLIVPVGVAFGTDTRKVSAVLREIAEEQPLVLLNPPPMVAFMGFGADSMNFEVRVILRDVNFSLSVRTEINHRIVERFAEEGIEIPFAQQEITLRNIDELGEALRGLSHPAAAVAAVASPAQGPRRPPVPPQREDYVADIDPDDPDPEDRR